MALKEREEEVIKFYSHDWRNHGVIKLDVGPSSNPTYEKVLEVLSHPSIQIGRDLAMNLFAAHLFATREAALLDAKLRQDRAIAMAEKAISEGKRARLSEARNAELWKPEVAG